jgi:ABC-type Fe3+/spermidine/putrescine transport system ATPase subunit
VRTASSAAITTDTPTHAPYVRIRGLDKIYHAQKGDILALRNVDFDLCQGEFLSIVGPSGCGKSTLLKCMAGLAPISAGTIEVKGKPVIGPPDNMGIVFQRDVLLEWLDIIDNVLLPIRFARLRKSDWEGRARANCWRPWACAASSIEAHGSCRAGCDSGFRSAAPCCEIPSCC